MKKFNFIIRGHKYNVEVRNQEGKVLDIEVNGSQYQVELDREPQQRKTPTLVRPAVSTHKKIEKKEQAVQYPVKSPLPGTIMRIAVQEGDTITPGDTLLVYEAMKMENELKAEKAGTVRKIHVKAGDNILQDETLMLID